jgi:hypothetical protein
MEKVRSFQCRLPELLQVRKRMNQGLPFGKYKKRQPRGEIVVQRPHKLAKHPLGAVATNRGPEALTDDDPDPAGRLITLVGE